MVLPACFPAARRGVIGGVIALLIAPLGLSGVAAQEPVRLVSRNEAVLQAAAGPNLAIARADTVSAFAELLNARSRQNPALSTEYTKSAPQYHLRLELPVALPGIRGLRIGAAESARVSAGIRYAYARASADLVADTTYTRAIAARERMSLSLRNAQDAGTLRKIAIARRNAGDASDLDVELATVFAGQAANSAAADSLAFQSIVLDLQAVMGLADSGVSIYPSDSLGLPPPQSRGFANGSSTLNVRAAQLSVEAAQLALRVERRSIFSGMAVSAGLETHDPSGSQKGMLPVFGLIIPLPILNRNTGAIALARANEMRANAELQLARIQSRTEIARVERELATAVLRIELDKSIVTAANRVASMSLTAYREGAAPLTTSLEAQRSARETLMQYIDDIASAWIASAELRVLTMTFTELSPLR